MPLFPLPSVSSVRAAAKMRVEQFDPKLTSAEFDTQIASIIGAAGVFVTGEILEAASGAAWPFTSDQIEATSPGLNGAEEVARQLAQATNATQFEALARMWEEAGALNDEYDEESDRARKNADRELASLTGAIARIKVALDKLNAEVKAKPKRPRSSVGRINPVI